MSDSSVAPNTEPSSSRTPPRRAFNLTLTPALIAWAAVFGGAALRIVEAAGDRGYYMDEVSLVHNIAGRGVFHLTSPMVEHQLAPPAFLVVERGVAYFAGASRPALRVVPLLFGLASLPLFYVTARRYVSEVAATLAIWLFALNDSALYYSNEIKQYSCELFFAIATLWVADRLARVELTPRRAWAACGFGVLATWFSLTACFPLGAVGGVLVATALHARKRRRAAILTAVSATWAASFVAVFLLSEHVMMKHEFIWNWWDFAFLPIPPRSLADLRSLGLTFLNVFTNPFALFTPLGTILSAILAALLFFVGSAALARRDCARFLILWGPMVLTAAASATHKYPFHGRLLLFLAATVLLPIAEGMAVVGRRVGRVPLILLAALIFVIPSCEELDNVERPRSRPFDSHGDLRGDLFDHLERNSAGFRWPMD